MNLLLTMMMNTSEKSSVSSLSGLSRRELIARTSLMAISASWLSKALPGAVPEGFSNQFFSFRIQGRQDATNPQNPNIRISLPQLPMPSSGFPLVFLFGGNGMGRVVRSEQADAMALALNRYGVATVVLNYPNLVDETVFRSSIIKPIRELLEAVRSGDGLIDGQNFGFAGFSAGGLVATLLATRYSRELPSSPKAAVNYYGPVDLRYWFAFHQARFGNDEVPEDLKGRRSGRDLGYSIGGRVECGELSRRLVGKVSENLGGLVPGRLEPFSHDWLWTGLMPKDERLQTPVMGVFGTKDDNCDPDFQSGLIRKMKAFTGVNHQSRIYEGSHGMGWEVCPEAMQWLVGSLNRPVLS